VVAVVSVSRRIVDVHLEEVLVEAVVAAVPAASGVEEAAVRDCDCGAQEAGEGDIVVWSGGEEVGFRFLGQGTISGVPREVGEVLPFQHEGADGCEFVRR